MHVLVNIPYEDNLILTRDNLLVLRQILKIKFQSSPFLIRIKDCISSFYTLFRTFATTGGLHFSGHGALEYPQAPEHQPQLYAGLIYFMDRQTLQSLPSFSQLKTTTEIK